MTVIKYWDCSEEVEFSLICPTLKGGLRIKGFKIRETNAKVSREDSAH